MTTCPFNYVEDCRAADVLQKCAGKNVHNCKKWKICIDMTTCLSNYMEWCRCIAKVHKYKSAYLRKKSVNSKRYYPYQVIEDLHIYDYVKKCPHSF